MRNKIFQHKQAGYTIDQTILIVAVIAILVTMIVGTVGWDLLSRAGATKLQSHLRQFENAAGSFYAQYNVWPNQASANPSDPSTNFRTLIAKDALDPAYQTADFRNYLQGYRDNGSGNPVNHPFGSGNGEVTLTTATDNGQTYIVFEMTGVPSEEFMKADESMDNDKSTSPTYDYTRGRLRALEDPKQNSTVTLQYYANVVQ